MDQVDLASSHTVLGKVDYDFTTSPSALRSRSSPYPSTIDLDLISHCLLHNRLTRYPIGERPLSAPTHKRPLVHPPPPPDVQCCQGCDEEQRDDADGDDDG